MNANSDKTILVTGSSKGLGAAIACRLAEDGYSLAIHYVNDQAGAEQTLDHVRMINQQPHRLLQFDIADRSMVKQRISDDIDHYGGYYGLVLNAGITQDVSFPSMLEDDWDNIVHTNLDGFYNVVHPVLMPMIGLKKGRIVTLSSLSGQIGNRGQVHYSAAKAGIIGATKALATELSSKRREITVNCVAPGLIETAMVQDHIKERLLPQIPMQRLGKPEEVAGIVAFLMSSEASYINRQVIGVNGGLY